MSVDLIALALEDIGRWDSQLLELIHDKKVDPWDIDIVELTSSYLKRIRGMEKMDFRVPGKAVATASVLLRIKSEKLLQDKQEQVEREHTEALPFQPVDLPKLKPLRRMVERKITILELVDALRGAFEIEKGKMQRRAVIRQIINFSMFDMSRILEAVRIFLAGKMTEHDSIEMREVFTKEVGVDDLVSRDRNALIFICLLHLANDEFISLEQEGWNSPIFIKKRDLDRPVKQASYAIVEEVVMEEESDGGSEETG